MMTTVVTVTIYGGSDEILDGAMELCKDYENLFSRTISDSDVSNINHSGGSPVAVSHDTAELIKSSLEISRDSGGAFDITVLPLSELWDVEHRTAPPDDKLIEDAKAKVGFEQVTAENDTVTLKSGASVDLGGIAKGYIADKVRDYLKENKIKKAIINLGGNVVLIGNNDGKPYTVGIQKPFGANGEVAASLKLSDKTAVTSGIYERYFSVGDEIYHHIIDPATGRPASSDVASVTVICESSAIADGLSTACLCLGAEKSAALLKSYGAEAVFISRSGELSATDGLEIEKSGDLPEIRLR